MALAALAVNQLTPPAPAVLAAWAGRRARAVTVPMGKAVSPADPAVSAAMVVSAATAGWAGLEAPEDRRAQLD